MIDIHVLTYSGTQPQWLEQCLESITSQSGATLHVVQGDEGNVGSGRARAYLLGEHEYVGYVDSDDYLLPGAVETCLEAMQRWPAVVTLERRLWGDRLDWSRTPAHHIAVYRRADVIPYLAELPKHPLHCDVLLLKKLAPHQLDFEGYVWRMHARQGHRAATVEQKQAMEAA